MPDTDAAASATPPPRRGLRKLGSDFWSGYRNGLLGWLTAAAVAATVGWFALQSERVRDLWRDRQVQGRNITLEEAFRIARMHSDGQVLWAVPFRNRTDDVQRVAAFVKVDEPACSDRLAGPQLDACYAERGWTRVDLMTGEEGVYEARRTDLRAMVQYMPPDAASPASLDSAAFRRSNERYFGITDWNDDGDKEVLAIAEPSDNSTSRLITVGLHDVIAGKTTVLSVTEDDVGTTFAFRGEAPPPLRAWLGARYREFAAAIPERVGDCRRGPAGALTCTAAAPSPAAGEEAQEEAGDGDLRRLVDHWVERNGRGFTTGRIDVRFEPIGDVAELGPGCPLGNGRTLHNIFKGPLVIAQPGSKTASVLYQQAAEHHREIPLIVLGRDYVWLALSTGRGIMAVRRGDLTMIEAHVDDWRDGIPDVGPGAPPGATLQKEGKDIQLWELRFANGRLLYGDRPVDFSVGLDPFDQTREFAGATTCDMLPG